MNTAPTCFSLQRNHHQGATTSTWLKIQAWFSVDTDVVQMLSVFWRHNVTVIKTMCIKYIMNKKDTEY
jgi:hypothetical protein